MLSVPSRLPSSLVDEPLLERVDAVEQVGDLAVHVADRGGDALAAVALAAVAQLDRLVLAGRGTGRHGGPADGPAVERDLDLDGGVATRVEDFTADDADDLTHGTSR